jgi:hypothetical protein
MTNTGKFADQPHVALDPLKLFGLKQVAKVSGGRVGASPHDPVGPAGEKIGPSAAASRLLSKVGSEITG